LDTGRGFESEPSLVPKQAFMMSRLLRFDVRPPAAENAHLFGVSVSARFTKPSTIVPKDKEQEAMMQGGVTR
jgi:hypothetical protein